MPVAADAERERLRANAIDIIRDGVAERVHMQLRGERVNDQNTKDLIDRLHKRAMSRMALFDGDEERQLAFVREFDRDAAKRRKRQA